MKDSIQKTDKKKIDIITIHSQTNFGSVFQAFALNRYLLLAGYECRIIDYRPDYIEKSAVKGWKGIIKNMLFGRDIRATKKKYDEFIRNHIILTPKRYVNIADLRNLYLPTDLLIAGSDQLWNTKYACGKDDSYRLAFDETTPKISYSTSLNDAEMTENDTAKLAEQLKKFSAVSVREKSAAEVLKKEIGRDVKWVCDPVFLLDRSEYLNMCIPMMKEEYILVYLADEGELLEKTVAIEKEKTGCKVISVCGVKPHCKCDLHLKSPGPIEMLSLINGAKLIITGSFHATSFSHILHKNFIVLPPKQNSNRIVSLLSVSGLEKQFCRSVDDLSNASLLIDFSESDKRMKGFIEESKKWLEKNIKEILK